MIINMILMISVAFLFWIGCLQLGFISQIPETPKNHHFLQVNGINHHEKSEACPTIISYYVYHFIIA